MSLTSNSQSEPLELHVGSSIKHRRIDRYLHGRFSDLSRSFIQDAIKAGSVKVNGKLVKPSFKLSPGDKIDLTLPEPPSKEILPEDIPLNIIYEDDDIIVLDKQPAMLVHPARGNTHGTLVNALVFYSDKLSSGLGECGTGFQPVKKKHGQRWPCHFRPGIVHRLDKNTTGVMVVTKNDTAQGKIARQFERRQVNKTYLAVVHGTPELTRDRINAPLGVHPKMREKYAIRSETGKEAITFYEVLESFRGFSLLEMTPKTGRTHQIRVHLSYIKHPIVADDMYGGKLVYPWQLTDAAPGAPGGEPAPQSAGHLSAEPIIDRVALHASTLEFKHPTADRMMKFEAPLPEDMQKLLDLLRKHRML